MILLWLTSDEAQLLADTCIIPQIREQVKRRMGRDLLPCDQMPKMVLLHDDGSGLVAVATEYYSEADADRAFDLEWKRLMGEPIEQTTEAAILTGRKAKKKRTKAA